MPPNIQTDQDEPQKFDLWLYLDANYPLINFEALANAMTNALENFDFWHFLETNYPDVNADALKDSMENFERSVASRGLRNENVMSTPQNGVGPLFSCLEPSIVILRGPIQSRYLDTQLGLVDTNKIRVDLMSRFNTMYPTLEQLFAEAVDAEAAVAKAMKDEAMEAEAEMVDMSNTRRNPTLAQLHVKAWAAEAKIAEAVEARAAEIVDMSEVNVGQNLYTKPTLDQLLAEAGAAEARVAEAEAAEARAAEAEMADMSEMEMSEVNSGQNLPNNPAVEQLQAEAETEAEMVDMSEVHARPNLTTYPGVHEGTKPFKCQAYTNSKIQFKFRMKMSIHDALEMKKPSRKL